MGSGPEHRSWWHQLSRRGKAAVAGGVLAALFVGIGTFGDSQEDASSADAVTVTEAPTAPATEAAPAKAVPKPRAFAVARVVDGDTVELAGGAAVRLVQIDAPEVRSGECYAVAAAQMLDRLLPAGTRVRIETDPALDRVDAYGRTLAYVFKGRENVNRTLVLRGAASVWFYDGDRGRYASELLAAARDAKRAQRGLWRACPATELDPSPAVTTVTPTPTPPLPPQPQPPAPEPSSPPPAAANGCHPSYEGACLDPAASDYDCAGGSGNGPEYTGPVRVVGPDDYGLDRDGDGAGCE